MVALTSTAIRTQLPHGSETILFVDDSAILVELTRTFLCLQGYTVHTALNGIEALKVLEQYSLVVDLVFTDVVMPLMGGPELAQHVRNLYPRIKVLFGSGYVGEVLEQYGMTPELGRFIEKPYRFEVLSSCIRDVFDSLPA